MTLAVAGFILSLIVAVFGAITVSINVTTAIRESRETREKRESDKINDAVEPVREELRQMTSERNLWREKYLGTLPTQVRREIEANGQSAISSGH